MNRVEGSVCHKKFDLGNFIIFPVEGCMTGQEKVKENVPVFMFQF